MVVDSLYDTGRLSISVFMSILERLFLISESYYVYALYNNIGFVGFGADQKEYSVSVGIPFLRQYNLKIYLERQSIESMYSDIKPIPTDKLINYELNSKFLKFDYKGKTYKHKVYGVNTLCLNMEHSETCICSDLDEKYIKLYKHNPQYFIVNYNKRRPELVAVCNDKEVALKIDVSDIIKERKFYLPLLNPKIFSPLCKFDLYFIETKFFTDKVILFLQYDVFSYYTMCIFPLKEYEDDPEQLQLDLFKVTSNKQRKIKQVL